MNSQATRSRPRCRCLRIRARIEEIFGWLKTVGLMRKQRHRGCERVAWLFTLAVAVYDLVRIRNLTATT